MTNVQQFIEKQYGNSIIQNYDSAFKYLRCSEEDEQNGIGPVTPSHSHTIVSPIFACRFAQKQNYEHFLALANEEGQLAIHNTKIQHNSIEKPMRICTNAHYNAIFDLAWMFGEMKIVTASGDHTARLFSVSQCDIVEERIFHGHTRSVKTVAFRKNDPAVFATGSRDGAIYLWDTRATVTNNYVKQADTVIANSHVIPQSTPSSQSKKKKFPYVNNPSAANSVTSVVFQNDFTLISCGASDGVIKVWDLRKNYLIYKREPLPKFSLPYCGNTSRNGFSNLIINESGVKLYANCLDNNIYCYNIAKYNPVPIATYNGHFNNTFYIKSSLSADENYLLSGSSDQSAYIWNINKSTPLLCLKGHTAEVTCVAFCQKHNPTLITCSDDMKYKIWRLNPLLKDKLHHETHGEAVLLQNTQKFQTPTSKKRRFENDTTPISHERKKQKICENCQMYTPGSIEIINCETCKIFSRKRTSSNAKLTEENQHKKLNTEKTPRRLFEGQTSQNDELATILEEIEQTPPKNTHSVTDNLPNFVIDGEAPHLKNFSPKKKIDKDWLTKMRIEHDLKNRLEELSNPRSPKQLKFSENCYTSPKSCSGKKNKRTTPTNSRAQSPLLKFFKVTNNISPLNSKNCNISSDVRNIHM